MIFSLLVSDDEPTLRGVLELLGHRIRDKCDSFGKFLLEDETGEQMANIKKEYGRKARDVTMRVVDQWVKSAENVTWEHLVLALKKCGLSHVADEIDMARKSFFLNDFCTYAHQGLQ